MSPPTPNPRARLRRNLVLAGLLPTVLVLLFALEVALTSLNDRAGRDRFGAEAYDDAAGQFGDNRSVNVIEPWVAPFDEGAALHADGDLTGAVESYEAALEDVPSEEACTVRINLALAHEGLGDAALEEGDAAVAIEEWQAGVDVLADGRCPDPDAGTAQDDDQLADAQAVDQRLRDKIEQQQSEQQQQQPQDPQQQDPQEQDDPPDPKEEELERRNRQGNEERKDWEDLNEDFDFDSGPQW